MSEMTLRGGTAVVTGGAGVTSGLGQGMVRRLAAAGMRVAILDRDEAAANALAESLRAAGGDATAIGVDITDHDSLESAAAQVRETYGSCHVLCAHVGGGDIAAFADQSIAAWRQAMELMVVGTVATVQAFLPLLRATDGARRIVLTASAAALAPGRYQGPYRAAKAAVTSIGETLDLELGPDGIGTTIVFPSGMLLPEIVEMARGIDFEQAAAAGDLGAAVSAEMIPDPLDLISGEDAAAPIVDAIGLGRRYVITHGATLVHNARARFALLEEAFDDLAERQRQVSP